MSRPPIPAAVRRRFWLAVREGLPTEEAARSVGVSTSSGRRLFTEAGGMSPMSLAEPSGRALSPVEREEILRGLGQGLSKAEIARRLGRHRSTIGREIARNCQRGRPDRYSPRGAQMRAEQRSKRPKDSKLSGDRRLRDYVQSKLDGSDPQGPPAHRGQRVAFGAPVSRCWSPQQIAGRLRVDFPHDESMRVSHEAVYRGLYVQPKGVLRRELAACLRTGRAVRQPRRRADRRQSRVPAELLISQRPPEVEDRAVSGHWEGDLILGTGNASAVGTLVERGSRFVMLLHLPGRHGAEDVRDAMLETITTLPAALRRTLTWDQGIEMARHVEITIATGLEIYFCDPHSPWQRGTNENTNGLLRQYLPKGSDLSVHTAADLAAIADALNGRPRKTLNYRTPAEAMNDLLLSPPTDPLVATTG